MSRGTGRTTALLMGMPKDGVFVCAPGAVHYVTNLTKKHGRRDVKVVSPSWLRDERWAGRELSALVLDHDLVLTGDDPYAEAFRRALSRVKEPA